MFDTPFGSENAESDKLLRRCYINPPATARDKPILLGKWGTGKTAHILRTAQSLDDALTQKSKSLSRLWYIPEGNINISAIESIVAAVDGERHALKRAIEDIWEAEIIITHLSLLINLWQAYGQPAGPHWEAVRNAHKLAVAGETLWTVVGSALGALIGRERAAALDQGLRNVQRIAAPDIKRAINRCIEDAPRQELVPIVAVEPIETPNSDIETRMGDIADLLVTSLMNVFIKLTAVDPQLSLPIMISIPWHRYKRESVGQPQKVTPYIGHFRWTRTSLRAMINKRIELEFSEHGRQISRRNDLDAWQSLFGKQVINENCGGTLEDTFDYVLRHTQYRVRDLLRLTRSAVEAEANANDQTVPEFLSDRASGIVQESALRLGVKEACIRTAKERIIEAERKFTGLAGVVDRMKGMNVPFSADELKKRLSSAMETVDINTLMGQLWDGGIIGIQLTALSPVAQAHLKSILPVDAAERHLSLRALPKRYFIFEHTASDESLAELLSNYSQGPVDIRLEYILHPMMFEYMFARLPGDLPIGC